MVLTKKFSEFVAGSLNNSNETVGLSGGANARFPGITTWTTATRPTTPGLGLLGYNSTLGQYEFYDNVAMAWVQLEDSNDVANLIARLAAHTAGDGASMIGLENQGAVTDKTVQDLAEASFIVKTDNGTLVNAQVLADLTQGMLSVTPVTGVLVSRELTGTANEIDIANGDGSGVPTFSLSATLDAPGTFTIQGTTVINAIIDDDTMATATDQNVPTAESVVAYIGGGGPGPFLPLAGGTMAGDIDFDNTYTGINVIDPTNPQDIATKNYVDQTALTGTSVYAASAASLGTVTQAGAGVGATLTNAGVQAALVLDGATPSVGDNVLIKDTAIGMTAANEGIYTVTDAGSGATNWVLTRATTYNTPAEINQTGLIVVRNGSTLAGSTWYNSATIVTVDTTNFSYSRFGATYVESVTGTANEIDVDNSDAQNPVLSLSATLDVPGTFTIQNTVDLDAIIDDDTMATATATNVPTSESVVQYVNQYSPNAAQPNIIIGGNFATNPWQRGTSFTAPADQSYTADRWQYQFIGTGVVNILKTADAPTVAEAGFYTDYCLHVDVTTADAAIAASDAYIVIYAAEGYDIAPAGFGQSNPKQITLSFWHKHTVTGTYCVGFRNGSSNRAYATEYTQAVADTWEKAEITLTADASGTWFYTNGYGLQILFTVAAGSDFVAAADTWVATNDFITSNQVNGMSDAANNFKLALVKLELGSVATPYPVELEVDVLARCQRYYYKTFPQGTAPVQNVGSNVGALAYRAIGAGITAQGSNMILPVVMRAAPTVTFYSPFEASSNWYNSTLALPSGASSVTSALGQNQFFASGTNVAGDTQYSFMTIHLTASAEL